MLETKKGANRFVIFTARRAYKLASLRYFFGVIKNIPRMIKNGDGSFILKELRWGWRNFTRGISENISEYRCWNRLQSPFLAKTYFCFGILNISQRLSGPAPLPEELRQAFSKLPLAVQNEIKTLEAHCIEPDNFIKTNHGLILVDYDNGTSPTAKIYPFTLFLEKWHKELENVLLPKIR